MRNRRFGFGSCDANLQPLVYRPSRASFWASTLPFWASTALHDSILNLQSFWILTWMRIRIQLPKLMRIRLWYLLINQPIKLTYWSYEMWALATQKKLEKSITRTEFLFSRAKVFQIGIRNDFEIKRFLKPEIWKWSMQCEHCDSHVWIRIHIM